MNIINKQHPFPTVLPNKVMDVINKFDDNIYNYSQEIEQNGKKYMLTIGINEKILKTQEFYRDMHMKENRCSESAERFYSLLPLLIENISLSEMVEHESMEKEAKRPYDWELSTEELQQEFDNSLSGALRRARQSTMVDTPFPPLNNSNLLESPDPCADLHTQNDLDVQNCTGN